MWNVQQTFLCGGLEKGDWNTHFENSTEKEKLVLLFGQLKTTQLKPVTWSYTNSVSKASLIKIRF